MANLFREAPRTEELQSHGFEKYDDEYTIAFVLTSTDLPNFLNKDVTEFATSEHYHFIANRKCKIFRKDLLAENGYQIIPVPFSIKLEAPKFHPDLFGYHCVVTSSRGRHGYISSLKDLVDPLELVNNLDITVVAYSPKATPQKTHSMLLGCGNGSIYLYKLRVQGNLEIKELAPKKLFQVPSGEGVKGLVYRKYKDASGLVVVTTDTSCYQFVGKLPWDVLFGNYGAGEEVGANKIATAKSGGELKTYYSYKEEGRYKLKSFAWKAGDKVLHGDFTRTASSGISNALSTNYPSAEAPEAVAVTKYCLCLLYANSLQVISRITGKAEYTEVFRPNEYMKQIQYDPRTSSVWIGSDTSVYQLKVQMREEDTWQQHLENRDYDRAMSICKKHNSRYLAYVTGVYADDERRDGNFKESAFLYTQSDRTFEEIMLDYFMKDDTEGMAGSFAHSLRLLALPPRTAQRRP